jgi:hypothetical protein
MTLTSLSRSATPEPVRLPRSPARAKVAAAVSRLQEAVNDLYREAAEEAARREKARQESDAYAERAALRARARLAAKATRIEVDRRFFWNLAGEACDALDELRSVAQERGEQGRARSFEARIDSIAPQLEKIQQQQIGGGK